MSQLPRYESYKDSGVQWLGEIPSHWNTMAVRRILEEHRQGYYTNEPYIEDGVKLARITDIQSTSEMGLDNSPRVENKVELKEFFLQENDFLFARTGGAGSFGIVRQKDLPAVYASYLIRFRFKETVEAEYLKFFFKSSYFLNSLVANIHGGVNQNIHAEDIKSTFLALPPIEEQKEIANFLNAKIEKVNILIAKQETLLEKLAEQRVALISHAVTKGLNPDVEMKESGVEWFNSVPQHWTISKLSYSLNAVGDVDHYMPESLDDQGVPYVMTGDLKELVSDINFEQCKQVSHDDYLKLSKKIKTTKGDIIFARYATIGTLSYVDIEKEFLVSYSCVTIKSNLEKLLGTYLYYYFKSDAFFKEVQKQINTNTQGNVGIDNLRRIKVLLPPLSEQEEIVDFLNIETRKIDDMKEIVEKTIERFKEYSSTLITQVVTGKIDVRNHKLN